MRGNINDLGEKLSADVKKISKKHNLPRRDTDLESQELTVEKLQSYIPTKSSIKVTQALIDEINKVEEEIGLPQEHMEERFLSNMHLLSGSGITLRKVIDAVKYCELCRHYSNKKAWSIIKPKKYNELLAAGKQIDNHVSSYEQGALIVEIKKNMLLPLEIKYAPAVDEAAGVLINLMRGKGAKEDDKVSPTVQMESAKTIIERFSPDKQQQLQVSIAGDSRTISAQEKLAEQIKRSVDLAMIKVERGEDIKTVQVIGVDLDERDKDDEDLIDV